MDTKKIIDETDETLNKSSLVFGNFIVLVVFVLLVGGVYYWVSAKNKGQQVFPAGINYLSPKGNEATKPVLLYDFAKLAESSNWLTFTGKLFPFSFQYPKELKPITYPDGKDSVTFKVNTSPPEQNLFVRIETISDRDKNLVGKPKEYVNNYWKFFSSGLSGVKTVTEVTNEKGLKGYKANYIIKNTNATTSDIYFFVIEGDSDNLIYVGNIFPTEGKALFDKIMNSLEYKK